MTSTRPRHRSLPARAGVPALLLAIIAVGMGIPAYLRWAVPRLETRAAEMRADAPTEPEGRVATWFQFGQPNIHNALVLARFSTEQPWYVTHVVASQSPDDPPEVWGMNFANLSPDVLHVEGMNVVLELPAPGAPRAGTSWSATRPSACLSSPPGDELDPLRAGPDAARSLPGADACGTPARHPRGGTWSSSSGSGTRAREAPPGPGCGPLAPGVLALAAPQGPSGGPIGPNGGADLALRRPRGYKTRLDAPFAGPEQDLTHGQITIQGRRAHPRATSRAQDRHGVRQDPRGDPRQEEGLILGRERPFVSRASETPVSARLRNVSAGAIFACVLFVACSSTERGGRGVSASNTQRLEVEPLSAESGPVGAAVPGTTARCPRLVRSGAGLVLSWVEEEGTGARLMASPFSAGRWKAPRELARGEDWFVNWADTPGAIAGDAGLLAHWLVEDSRDAHAYGARWSIGEGSEPLHDDEGAAEHGFVSAVALDDGFFSVWLDGRAIAEGGGMKVMGRTLGPEGPGVEIELDDRACTCCPTSAVVLADGSILAAYRDRDEREVRDISVVRGYPGEPGSWSAPRVVHDDGWVMLGCPVNGPSLAANGERVALAWFTMGSEGRAQVKVAFSDDGGKSFGWPLPVDDGAPFGRAAVAAVPGRDAFVVGWLEEAEEEAQWRLRLFEGGAAHASVVLADVSGERADGFLSLGRGEDSLFASWTDADAGAVRLARIRVLEADPAR